MNARIAAEHENPLRQNLWIEIPGKFAFSIAIQMRRCSPSRQKLLKKSRLHEPFGAHISTWQVSIQRRGFPFSR